MDNSLNTPRQTELRVVPRWVRIGVWFAIAFLTLSVISGMFLY